LSAIILDMSMSLDGFVTGPNATIENPLGDGGERLHDWIFPVAAADHHRAAEQQLSGVNRQLYDEIMSTGAVVAGRGTYEGADGWGGDHHAGEPIWIVSRHEPGIDIEQWPNVTYTSDIVSAMTEAKRAAGDENVLFHGAEVLAQVALAAGLVDELEIHVVPMLLGGGRRLFDGLGSEDVELERTRVLEGEGGVTHLHYRVRG
jgi:dihydrofolate reductase